MEIAISARIRALQARKAEQITASRALMAVAEAANRDFTAEEQTQFDGYKASIASINASIERENAMALEEAGMSASAAASAAGAAASHVVISAAATLSVEDNRAKDTKRGFAHIGDFAKSVQGAALAMRGQGSVDDRLSIVAAAPGTFAGEGNGADGGFLIPPDFSQSIFQLSLGDQALLPMTDNIPVSGNGMAFPKDETTPWGTNGVRAYWQNEAGAGTPTKPVFGEDLLRLKKLLALVPVSNEMLADSTALGAFLPKKIGMSIQWKTNEAILFGPGNGVPQGALNSAAAIVVAKDSGQATLTLSAMNLANMIARLPAGSYPNAFWLLNNDVLPALFTMTLGNYPIYIPGGSMVGGITTNPYGMLLGRPIMISQHAKSFTSQGDVNLLDLSYYQAITKAQGVQTDTSMHLYFDADTTAFRTTFRMDGQSKIASAISPANGSNKMSPFVQLAAR